MRAGGSGTALVRCGATIPDELSERPDDLVNRSFSVPRPNALLVPDPTFVRTVASVVCAAFVIEAFVRRMVGRPVRSSPHGNHVLDDLERR